MFPHRMRKGRVYSSDVYSSDGRGLVAGVGGGVLALLLLAAPAGAVEKVLTMGGNVGATPLVLFEAATTEWGTPGGAGAGAGHTNGSVVGENFTFWNINPSGVTLPGSFHWSGSLLDTDNNPGGPQADGSFLAGGTLTISGDILNMFYMPVFSGVLLEATLSGFRIQESSPTSNNLDLVGGMTLVPTGGFLVTNSLLNMAGDVYDLSFTIGSVQQMTGTGPGDLDDFQNDIFTFDTFNYLMVKIAPEPTTGVILGVAMVFLLPRRRGFLW